MGCPSDHGSQLGLVMEDHRAEGGQHDCVVQPDHSVGGLEERAQ
jgi:hypothetical protein